MDTRRNMLFPREELVMLFLAFPKVSDNVLKVTQAHCIPCRAALPWALAVEGWEK